RWPSAPSWLRSPLLGPALMPLVCVVVLFGPVPGWAAGNVWVGWLVHLVLLAIGSVLVLPLVRADERASSLAVGAAVAVGFVELLVDAIPGIVLRLSTHPVSGFFSHRPSATGAPNWLHDQQVGGGILWCVAELLDLPFLLLVFRQWVRADNREAAAIDAALDAEAAEAGQTAPAGDQPWFVNDPRLRDRLR
ncbi:MAG TPA: cytochrome c oxidase assembly protein, partial [Jatrophihabitans sp.]|nr:cytochrome c oxidase assembly protein [Jatrophihabitans sp.]